MSIEDHLQPGEQILYQAHPSLVPLAAPLFLAAAAAIAGLAAWRYFQQGWALALAGLVAVPALVLALARYVRLSANRYILTDRRLLRISGVFSRASMDSYLDKINNVEHRQTFWGRLVGYGDVEVDTASETGAEVFPRIGDPVAFKRAIDAATLAYRNAVRAPGRAAPASAAAGAAPSGADKIRELKRLLDDGLISQAEFEAKRKQILEQL
jgi:uncharacterized membrane protein YdbT with pleckstrin-like domain